MRRLAALLLGLLVIQGALGAQYAPDEVLVKFREETPLFAAAAAVGANARVIQIIPGIGVHRLRLSRPATLARSISRLRALPYVEFAEPNYILEHFEVPNDAHFPLQWNLTKIGCESAWDISHGSPSIIIAVIDTGIDLFHPDLKHKLTPGYDFRNGDPVPHDDNGHGTHVAGIAAASTNNGIGVSGVGFNCLLMPIKVLSSTGKGSVSDIALGVQFAIANGAKIVSLSLGSPNNSAALNAAVNSAWNNGILVVAAAGNSGSNAPTYPAAYANVIGVGATDENDFRTGFTNFGPWVSVAAPGFEVHSTYFNGHYRKLSGTSMSAPHVAGMGGLLWAKLGLSTDVAVIRQKIEENTVPVGNWLANGRIDVGRALAEQENGVHRSVPPVSLSVGYGTVLSGGLSSLLVSDDDRLVLAAARLGAGRRAEYWVSAFPEWQGERLGLLATIEGSASPSTPVTVSFWNWELARWDVSGVSVFGSEDRVFAFSASSPVSYEGPKGEVRVRVSRVEPRNKTFLIGADKVEIVSFCSE